MDRERHGSSDSVLSTSKTLFLSPRIVLGLVSTVFVLLLLYPWLVIITFLAFVAGYAFIHYFDKYSDHLDKLVQKWTGIKIAARRRDRDNDGRKTPTLNTSLSSSTTLALTDPLSSSSNQNQKGKDSSNLPNSPPKLPNSLKTLSSTVKEHSNSNSSPAFTPTPYHMPKIEELNLKIDAKLDASISKFVSCVFDYYVGSEWAPYLTRRQLKLAFKQLLTNVGERVNLRLSQNPEFPEELSKTKLIPLILHYTVKIQTHLGGSDGAELIFPAEKQQKTRLKVRRLCRMIIFKCIQNEDERRCKLWMELCIAVLADGVFWNLFQLGRDQIPELVVNLVKTNLVQFGEENCDMRRATTKSDTVPTTSTPCPDLGHDEIDNSGGIELPTSIPFLLDNFLDPKDSLEQADPIISRWRPTLKEIVDETELLYPLIQYLKHVGGQKALAYLQAVLDDSPDAKDHCRRVLEVEYLPGFCRSNFFHESMGLSRVEQGTEVITDRSPGTMRRLNKGHSRSSSYGSKNNPGLSDMLRIESGVVDGLPLYYDLGGTSSISSSGSSFALTTDVVETDSFFKKKSPLEDIVAKFLKASLSSQTQSSTSSSDSSSVRSLENSPKRCVTPRVGIDIKSYKELDHPEVTSRVKIEESGCDVFRTTSDIVISTISTNSWLAPVLSCWITFLSPYLKPHFDHKLEEALKEFLTLDLFITSVDLITDAFNSSGSSDSDETRNSNPDIPVYNSAYKDKNDKSSNSNSTTKTNDNLSTRPTPRDNFTSSPNSTITRPAFAIGEKHNVVLQNLLRSLLDIFVSKVVDVDKFLGSLSLNRDYIFLFFVDILDLLVFELFGDCCDIDDEMNEN